jgi:hypothetical protein
VAVSDEGSAWQAVHGVQPAAFASSSVIFSSSSTSMNRIRMQFGVWYLGTPGMIAT